MYNYYYLQTYLYIYKFKPKTNRTVNNLYTYRVCTIIYYIIVLILYLQLKPLQTLKKKKKQEHRFVLD